MRNEKCVTFWLSSKIAFIPVQVKYSAIWEFMQMEGVRIFQEHLFEFAGSLGFELVGIASAEPPGSFADFQRWIDDGFYAGMDYLARNPVIRADPQRLLPGAQSILMLGVSYQTVLESEPEIRRLFFSCGEEDSLPIADYACGIDYHIWVRKRLKLLAQWHRRRVPQGSCRGCVDTAPLLERQYAQNAGLGKIGKNTMLIHPDYGSRFFLAALLTTEELEPTQPITFDPCGDCRRCQNACPYSALGESYRLDARKCLNYWTIEHGNGLPDDMFGCDLCQNACPWNREKLPTGSLSRKMLRETEPSELKSVLSQTPLMRRLNKT